MHDNFFLSQVQTDWQSSVLLTEINKNKNAHEKYAVKEILNECMIKINRNK